MFSDSHNPSRNGPKKWRQFLVIVLIELFFFLQMLRSILYLTNAKARKLKLIYSLKDAISYYSLFWWSNTKKVGFKMNTSQKKIEKYVAVRFFTWYGRLFPSNCASARDLFIYRRILICIWVQLRVVACYKRFLSRYKIEKFAFPSKIN